MALQVLNHYDAFSKSKHTGGAVRIQSLFYLFILAVAISDEHENENPTKFGSDNTENEIFPNSGLIFSGIWTFKYSGKYLR